MSDNPYSTPTEMSPGGITREEALAKVRMPATLLLITGIVSLLGALTSFAIPSVLPPIFESILEQTADDPNVTPEDREQLQQAIELLASPINYVSAVIGLVGALIICIGATKMKRLESFGLSMAACIVAIVPYLSACCVCLFPMAIGIWGIVVIANQDVKSHFS